MVCNINGTPVIVYNAIKELVALATEGNVPKTQAQIVNIGVEMIQKTRDFETGISKWFKRTAVEHTRKIFKPYFTAAHTALKLINGKNLRNTTYHQANKMEAEINTKFESMINEFLTGVHALVEGQDEAPRVKSVE